MGPGMFNGLSTAIAVMIPLAIVGAIALFCFIGWLSWFLVHHIQFL